MEIKTQSDIFFEFEGDNWFSRNKEALQSAVDRDLIIKIMKLYNLSPNNILEIGASNGWRLHELHSLYNCRCVAVEPSIQAIENGRLNYPDVTFHRGMCHDMPFGSSSFDLIIINFVFHWIDRMHLLQSIAEIDRVLSDNGILIIGDFSPDYPIVRDYHHLPGVRTYKQNYSATFEATENYQVVAVFTADHRDMQLYYDIESDERISITILKKGNGVD